LERREIGNRNRKNTRLSKIFGIIKLRIFANFIHIHSIFLLKKGDAIPVTPTIRDIIPAHFQLRERYIIKNPIEIIKIVDFEVSVFMFSS